jgi:hypothetical protein
MNPVTGEKIVTIQGRAYTVRYTWRALAEIEAAYGDSPNLFNAEVLAKVAAAGMKEKHPDITAEGIMDLSPPLVPFARDIQQALQWAYFGAGAIPDMADDVKKKGLTAGLWKRIKSLAGRE